MLRMQRMLRVQRMLRMQRMLRVQCVLLTRMRCGQSSAAVYLHVVEADLATFNCPE
jgi:hypothetical protein